MRIIVFIFYINWINQYHWYINTLRAFFCVNFFRYKIFFQLLDIFYYIWVHYHFFIILLTFSQISLFLFKTFSSFIKKDIYSVSSKSILYAFISKKNMHKGLIFIISVISEIFKILFAKRKLFRYYFLLISILFIKIGLLYWWNSYYSISVLSNFMIFFIHFNIRFWFVL